MATRGQIANLDSFRDLDRQRRAVISETEQLKQRQYMMDRWMPMQQMMMDQMMQHQHWMMQPPASPKP